MAGKKQNPLAIFTLLAVIAIAILLIVRAGKPKQSSKLMSDWTCEKCGYQFVAPVQEEPVKCPKDGVEAVRTIYYYCSVHDHRFEAYRIKKGAGGAPLIKIPGGKWENSTGAPKIVCPLGNSDRSTLKPSPAGG